MIVGADGEALPPSPARDARGRGPGLAARAAAGPPRSRDRRGRRRRDDDDRRERRGDDDGRAVRSRRQDDGGRRDRRAARAGGTRHRRSRSRVAAIDEGRRGTTKNTVAAIRTGTLAAELAEDVRRRRRWNSPRRC